MYCGDLNAGSKGQLLHDISVGDTKNKQTGLLPSEQSEG